MTMPEVTPMNPHTTILVGKYNGREVGRIPATAPNAEEYMRELVSHYGKLEIDYEKDPTDGLLAMLHGSR